jgi:hypothetical protein
MAFKTPLHQDRPHLLLKKRHRRPLRILIRRPSRQRHEAREQNKRREKSEPVHFTLYKELPGRFWTRILGFRRLDFPVRASSDACTG